MNSHQERMDKQQNDSYHPLLIASISPFAAPALRRAIHQPGNLTSLITSSKASRATSLLPDEALAHLLSVLYDEMKQGSNNAWSILNFVYKVFQHREELYVSMQNKVIEFDQGTSAYKDWISALAFMMVYDGVFKLKISSTLGDGYIVGTKHAALELFNLLMSSLMKYKIHIQKCFRPHLAQIEMHKHEIDNYHNSMTISKCYHSECDPISTSLSTKRKLIDSIQTSRESPRRVKDLHVGKINTKELDSMMSAYEVGAFHFDSCSDSDLKDLNLPKNNTENPPSETGENLAYKKQSEKNYLETLNAGNKASEVISEKLHQEALRLRAELLLLSPQATLFEHENFANKVIDLLKTGISASGMSGMKAVANLITNGSLNDVNYVAKVSSLQETTTCTIVKKFIIDKTSAVRTTMILRVFLLPILIQHDNAHPSRSIVSLITLLAKERPTEVVNTVFLPLLNPPRKCGCDLLLRVAKILSEEKLVTLIRAISSIEIKYWDDTLISITTTCIKLSLPDEMIKAISTKVLSLVQTRHGNANKLSALILAIVKHNGTQLKKLSLVGDFMTASKSLPTFVAKTVASSLKKL